jgi:hypothetical protein
MRNISAYVRIVVPFVWVGFIGAISFMEAWLKFRAPGVTLTTGLSIGKIVFSALNHVEVVAAALVGIAILAGRPQRWTHYVFYGLATGILLVQTFWVLPALAARIDVYVGGGVPPPSNLHVYFVGMEAVKLVALMIYGIQQIVIWKK